MKGKNLKIINKKIKNEKKSQIPQKKDSKKEERVRKKKKIRVTKKRNKTTNKRTHVVSLKFQQGTTRHVFSFFFFFPIQCFKCVFLPCNFHFLSFLHVSLQHPHLHYFHFLFLIQLQFSSAVSSPRIFPFFFLFHRFPLPLKTKLLASIDSYRYNFSLLRLLLRVFFPPAPL